MAVMERIMIFIINIFCPPLSVLLIAGPGMDALINTFLFIAGVLPGHIHGYYISTVYFHRKRKVRKGKYPGSRKTGIYSEKVWNGGASNQKVRDLWEEEQAEKRRQEEVLELKKSSMQSGNRRSKSVRY